jgi:hypothetical protein
VSRKVRSLRRGGRCGLCVEEGATAMPRKVQTACQGKCNRCTKLEATTAVAVRKAHLF